MMKVKLQPPSATDLPAYNPILPPTAITQVMLIANPHKVSSKERPKQPGPVVRLYWRKCHWNLQNYLTISIAFHGYISFSGKDPFEI